MYPSNLFDKTVLCFQGKMNNSTAVNQTLSSPETITPFSIMAWSVAFGTLAAMAIFGNSTVILAFSRNIKLHTRTNYIIVGLATADLLVGFIAVPLYISMILLYKRHLVIPLVLSVIYHAMDVFGGFASIFHLMLISLERFYAIAFPVSHRNSSKVVYFGVLVICWVTAGSLSVMHSIRYSNYNITRVFFILFCVCFTVAFIVICSMYLGIWRKAKSKKLIRKGSRKTLQKRDHEVMIAMSLLIVIIIFAVTWLPFFCINAVYFFQSDLKRRAISFDVIQFTKLLHYSNSAINPIIYSLKIPGFKKTFTSLLKRESTRSLRASFSMSRRDSSKKPMAQADKQDHC